MTGTPEDLPPGRYADLDRVLRDSPLLGHLGGELAGWGPGWAQVRLPTLPAYANLVGTVHGGVVAAAADAAFEAGCNSHGRVSLASTLTLHYTAPARLGTVLVARCEEVTRARRSASYRLDVHDADGVLVAWCQALAHRTSRWHLGEERWPESWRATH